MDQRLPSSDLEDGVFIQLNRRITNLNINEVINMDSSKISIYIWGSDIGRRMIYNNIYHRQKKIYDKKIDNNKELKNTHYRPIGS